MGYSSQAQQAPQAQASFPTGAVARGANQRPRDMGYRKRLFIESSSGGASMFINKKNQTVDINGGKKSKRGAKDSVSKFSSSGGLSNVPNIKHQQSNTNINDFSIDFGSGDLHSQNVNARSNSNNSSVSLFGGISGSGHSFKLKNLHTNGNTTKGTNTKANATNSDSFSIDYGSYSSIDSNDTNKTVGGKRSKIGKKTGSSGVGLPKISNVSNANKNVEYDYLSADLAGLNNSTNANIVSNDSTDIFFNFWSSGSGQSNTNKHANTTNSDSNSRIVDTDTKNKTKSKNNKNDKQSDDLISVATSGDRSYTVSELSSNQPSTDASSFVFFLYPFIFFKKQLICEPFVIFFLLFCLMFC